MTRSEYQKQYQKDYAASGKKSEAAKRYYQKNKFEICRKLRAKRFIDKIPDISFPADNYDLDAELKKHGCIKLKEKRKLQSLLDNSSEITSILGHKFNKK